jgi:hypothetical protein
VEIQSLYMHSLDEKDEYPEVPKLSTQLVLPCTLVSPSGTLVKSKSFIDSGATYDAFLDLDFARAKRFPLLPLVSPVNLVIADGRTSSAGPITHYTDLRLTIRGHTETLRFYVTILGRFQIILGKPWLNKHNPTVDWPNDSLTFNTHYCRKNCLPPSMHQELVQGVTPPSLPKPSTDNSAFKGINAMRPLSGADFNEFIKGDSTELWYTSLAEVCNILLDEIPDVTVPFDPHLDDWTLTGAGSTTIPATSTFPQAFATSSTTPTLTGLKSSWVPYMHGLGDTFRDANEPSVIVAELNFTDLSRSHVSPSRCSSHPPPGTDPRSPKQSADVSYSEPTLADTLQRAVSSLQQFQQSAPASTPSATTSLDRTVTYHYPPNTDMFAITAEDIDLALQPKLHVDPKAKVPEWLWKWIHLYDKKEAEELPPHREEDDIKIELKPGTTPKAQKAYNMSVDQLRVLKKYLTDELRKGYIRTSTSPAASPVLFAKKPGGGLRFCVDYRGLNEITIKNKYPIPMIRETLHHLANARFYTKLDVVAAFNTLRVREGDEWLTAFNTRYGLYESLVMPFGLSNAPSTFQAFINKILNPYLDVFCTAYIDDILIYSNTLKEHKEHVKKVHELLHANGLHLDVKKCEFAVREVTYLGLIIGEDGVRMDPAKIACITDWKSPRHVRDVQGFLGFSNFYRRFINNFSSVVVPLVNLTKKGTAWDWSSDCETAFQSLKTAFTTAPVLRHFDPSKEIVVECDSSDYVSSGILSQRDTDGTLHPVAFMSRKHSLQECNYEIYDKELLAIVRSFESWTAELMGAAYPITVITDHKNLEYFMTTKHLTRRQVRWSEFLSQFDWKIRATPGKRNGKADALTRRSQDLPADDTDPRVRQQDQALIKAHNLSSLDIILRPLLGSEPLDHKILRLLETGYKLEFEDQTNTALWKRCWLELTKPVGIPHLKDISLSESEIRGDRLYHRDRLYVPAVTDLRRLLMQTAHDLPESGHPGGDRLFEMVQREYWWPTLYEDCKLFATACLSCRRKKPSTLRYQGVLKPLPVPIQRWRNISVDFVGPLPLSSGFNMIMVVVDRLSKQVHLSACHSTMDTQALAKLFLRDVWQYHGLPESIVSDRGTLFVAEFWAALTTRLGVQLALSTAFHPESDGQTERTNRTIWQYLRQYVNTAQDDWSDWLPLAAYALNDSISNATGMSPFFANHGFHPRMSFSPPRPLTKEASKTIRDANRDGTTFANKMEDILQQLRTNMMANQAKMETNANARRSAAPAYRAGDQVFLDMRHMPSDRPSKKLDDRWAGPYTILRAWSHHYELDLDFELATRHAKFHANLLRPAPTKWYPGQIQAPAPAIGLDENGEAIWAIEAILDSGRVPGKGFQYLILWRGYGDDDRSWEPLNAVITAHTAVNEFHKRYPDKPKPSKLEKQRATDYNKRQATVSRLQAIRDRARKPAPAVAGPPVTPTTTQRPTVILNPQAVPFRRSDRARKPSAKAGS